ncbi:MAG TPA: hypothetical protein PKD57_14470 [Saprospiraceae bacterium]|nr:hypothetical protein [Saprospiraceae bacterium]
MFTGVSNTVACLEPNTSSDYKRVRDQVLKNKETWKKQLSAGRAAIIKELELAGYKPLIAEPRKDVLKKGKALRGKHFVVTSRLKRTDAIISKMQRFGESLANMLDVFGYRVIVSDEEQLEQVSKLFFDFWETPSKQELLLRRGELQFEWVRDYRKRNHAGLSSATSLQYDQAVHVNRRTVFGICEIQIITLDLYKRAFMKSDNDESHSGFTKRRKKLLKK